MRTTIAFLFGLYLGWELSEMLCPHCGKSLGPDTIEEFEKGYAEWLKTKAGQFSLFIAEKSRNANRAEGESESS